MRVIIQRVSESSLLIDGDVYSSISQGLVILLGVSSEDSELDVEWLVQKITKLRVFSDEEGKMNLSVLDISGEVLIVSQFTLFASTKKGTRPSFTKSAKPEIAIPLYNSFVSSFKKVVGDSKIKTGQFGADMLVKINNDGPVTISIDSRDKE